VNTIALNRPAGSGGLSTQAVYLVYSFLLTVGFLLFLPRFAIDAFRSRKYITGLAQRLGQIPKIDSTAAPLIWLHCVSVGETEAARPLVRALREYLPSHRLVVSTTTVTGQALARQAFGKDATAIFYFPIDWSWTVRRVLKALKPTAILIMETELWPNLLRECGRRSIPLAIVNGRLSPTSFRRYRKIRGFMQRVLGNLSFALMQSDEDSERISQLGLDNERIRSVGNMKFDSAPLPATDSNVTSELRRRYAFNSDQPVIVAASTHSPEETVAIESFKAIRENHKAARLLIAPRHPERFDEVAKLIADSGFEWSRRSASPSPGDSTAAIVLLDSIGELRAAYQFADIAFMGGSLIPHGGQNVLEPAAQGVCVITGAHTHNFAAITRALLAEEAMIQLPKLSIAEAPAALARAINELLRDEARRTAIGKRAQKVCDQNRGATQQTVELIVNLLGPALAVSQPVSFPAVEVTATR
jgi:3-deoxy-D-manno-octulosonic-acid transferase